MSSKEYLTSQFNTSKDRNLIWGLIRHPLVYLQPDTLDINYRRLPRPEQMKDMELACQAHTPPEDPSTTEQLIGTGVLAVSLFMGIFILSNFFFSTLTILSYGTILSLIASSVLFLRGRVGLDSCKWIVAAPFIVTFLMNILLANRVVFGIVMGIVVLVLFKKIGTPVFRFYKEWLTSYPWLTIEQRREILARDIPIHPDRKILFFIFFVGLIGSFLSVTGTILITYVLVLRKVFSTAKRLREPNGKRFDALVKNLQQIVSQYFHYNQGIAPGIWRPSETIEHKKAKLLTLFFVFYLGLNVVFCLMGPWDLVLLNPDFDLENTEGLLVLGLSPHSWPMEIIGFLEEMGGGGVEMVFAAAPLVHLTLPFFGFLAVFAKPVEELLKLKKEILAMKDQDPRPEWKWYVDRVWPSMHVAQDPLGLRIRESEHLFMGLEKHAKYPILLDRKILSEHAYISGETGSGKTSMGIMPILMQLMDGHSQEDGTISPMPPMVILDLKGDPALFHLTRHLAQQKAMKDAMANGIQSEEELRAIGMNAFKFFTPEQGKASQFFNPFNNLKSKSRSLIQLCNILLDSLSLNHGEGYGRSYYSQQSRLVLSKALAKNPKDFNELFNFSIEISKKENIRDIFELLAVINALTHYPQLGDVAEVPADEVIQMPDIIENRQVVYFWLPSALESVSVREIGKLAVYSFFTALVDRQRSGVDGEKPRQCYLVIDEFQRMAGQNFKIILEQARSFGLGAILSNQCLGDLKTPDVDLRPTIRTNTRLKMSFSISDPAEIKDMTEVSGQEIAMMSSFSESQGNLAGSTHSQSIKNRITINDVLEMSDSPLEMIFHVSRGSGYTQFAGLPIVAQSTWPISIEDYRAFSSQPWPETSFRANQQSPLQTDVRAREESKECLERIGKIIDEIYPDLP